VGLVAVVVGFALAAGLAAYSIDYDEGLHRFPRARARRRAATTGAVAFAVFASLGLAVVLVLLH